MLTRPQQILLKRAQDQAGIDDAEYRDTLERIAGCRSSTAPQISDDHLDVILSIFEAIYWRAVDSGLLRPFCKPDAPFLHRGYWASKNTTRQTSRDRYTSDQVVNDIGELERQLTASGRTRAYVYAIRARVLAGRADLRSMFNYRAALRRTLSATRKPL